MDRRGGGCCATPLNSILGRPCTRVCTHVYASVFFLSPSTRSMSSMSQARTHACYQPGEREPQGQDGGAPRQAGGGAGTGPASPGGNRCPQEQGTNYILCTTMKSVCRFEDTRVLSPTTGFLKCFEGTHVFSPITGCILKAKKRRNIVPTPHFARTFCEAPCF